MTPAAHVRSVIEAKIDAIPNLSLEHVHTFMIDPSDNAKEDLILVISELVDGGSSYGNDQELDITRQVQLIFYYPPNYEFDMSEIEKSVKQVLFDQRIRCFSDAGHVMTPDNQNIINTLKFKYTEEEV
jgi:hypothetical protein